MSGAEGKRIPDSWPDGVAVADRETGEVTTVDETWAESLGRSDDDLVGRSLPAAVGSMAADPAAVTTFLTRWEAIRTGEVSETAVDLTLETAGGQRRPVELELGTAERDGGRGPVVVACRETDGRAADGQPADGTSTDAQEPTGKGVDDPADGSRVSSPGEGAYRALIEEFPNGIATRFDEDLRYTLVGGTMFEELSVAPADLEGQTLHEAFPEANAEQMEPLYRAALEGEVRQTELSLEGHWFRIFVCPVRDDDGTVVGGMTVSQDITGLREHERKLDAARKRYRTLIEAAPDPIFVADADTGVLLEANEAAEDLLCVSRETIVGRDQRDLHPPEDADRYRQLFERHAEEDFVAERLEDGTPVQVVTEDGDHVPVAISTQTVTIDGQRVIYGIFRDNTDRIEYERTLDDLHERTRTLLTTRTKTGVTEEIVDAVESLLDLTVVCAYRFDDEDGVLRPEAWSVELEEQVGRPPDFVPGQSVAWQVFVEGERARFEEAVATEPFLGDDADVRSELLVPMGDFGVLTLGAVSDDRFDERTVDLLEILVETAVSAIGQIEQYESLKQQDNEMSQQLQHLERLEDVNGRIRDLTSILMQGDSRKDIEEGVCAHLAETDQVAFAWIGDPDPVDDVLVPRAWAGDGNEYLDQIDRSLSEENVDDPEPAVSTAMTREPTVVRNVARDVGPDTWRDDLVRKGYLSAMSVPLTYDDVFYGVLTVYARESSAFDGMFQSIMIEIAEAVGYAVNSIYRKHALSADQVSEFEFAVEDSRCFFLRFAQETGTPIEFEGMVPRDDGSAVVFADISSHATQDVLAYAERSAMVEEVRLLEEDDAGAHLQFRMYDTFIGATIADYGLSLASIEADADGCTAVVTSPPTINPRRVHDVVRTVLPEARLLAKRERVEPAATSTGLDKRYLADLTERQREIMFTAYRNGYFDSPKGASGKDIAEEMGISPTAFHDNLRAAERKLLATVVEGSSDTDD